MKKLFTLLLPLLLIGCGSFEKKHFKAVKFFNENETLAAEYCSGKFPSQTEYIKGDPIVILDTILSETVYAPDCPDGTKVECPKNKIITKTITITDTLKTPDLAREKVLNDKLNNCNADNVLLKNENEELKQKIKDKNLTLYLLCGVLILGLYLLIKKK